MSKDTLILTSSPEKMPLYQREDDEEYVRLKPFLTNSDWKSFIFPSMGIPINWRCSICAWMLSTISSDVINASSFLFIANKFGNTGNHPCSHFVGKGTKFPRFSKEYHGIFEGMQYVSVQRMAWPSLCTYQRGEPRNWNPYLIILRMLPRQRACA